MKNCNATQKKPAELNNKPQMRQENKTKVLLAIGKICAGIERWESEDVSFLGQSLMKFMC